MVLVRVTRHIMHIKVYISLGELPSALASIVRMCSAVLCYPRLAWIATILLDAIVVFRIVLGTRFHLIVITSVIVDILICVVHICIHLMESTSWSILLLVRAKSALSVVMGLVFIIRLVGIVVTFLMHHLPRCLQSTIRYLLLCIKLFCLAHRRLLLFLHF